MKEAPVIAIGQRFMGAFAKLPRPIQAKVEDFIKKFKRDPMSSGISYEKINARDGRLRSVRIDQTYRAIVLQAKRGNIHLLLWVDHHDLAYSWAANKRIEVHPQTGSLQVFESETGVDAPEPTVAPAKPSGLFDSLKDRQLVRAGIPEAILPSVRAIRDQDHLLDLFDGFPGALGEALLTLAASESYEAAIRHLEAPGPEQEVEIDVEDFETALENPGTQREFVVVTDDEDLEKMLASPLDSWRTFLHPTQRRNVEIAANGPVRVLGSAGTGKTVVAMHRARRLARALGDSPGRILFTTYNRNLAQDIEQNLRKLCEPEEMDRIDVTNLDRWVVGFLKSAGHEQRIEYKTDGIWDEVAFGDFDMADAKAEWRRVIAPNGIQTRDEYLRVPRTGMRKPLDRKRRAAFWPVFEDFRSALRSRNVIERSDAFYAARALLQSDEMTTPYQHIVVDEGQDMGAAAFRLLRAMVPEGPNDLFIVGDAHQSIYGRKVVLSQCGINIKGRGRRLRVNYRTTEQNKRWAVGVLSGVSVDDMDGGVDTLDGYMSLMRGPVPEVSGYETRAEEAAGLVEAVLGLGDPRKACIIARDWLLPEYEVALQDAGVPTYRLKKEAEDRREEGVRLATMHRVKGLEFDTVFIAGLEEGVVPRVLSGEDDPEAAELEERALLYVSATRARRRVRISWAGEVSRFLG